MTIDDELGEVQRTETCAKLTTVEQQVICDRLRGGITERNTQMRSFEAFCYRTRLMIHFLSYGSLSSFLACDRYIIDQT